MKVKVQRPAYGGPMIASLEKGVVFVSGVIPGELVEIDGITKSRGHARAELVKVLEPSPHRTEPLCPFFDRCGGCHYQHMSHDAQTRIKDEILRDCLKRIGGLDASLDPTLVSEPWGYRKRVLLRMSERGFPGFYGARSRSVVEVDACPLLDPGLNEFILRLREGGPFTHTDEIMIQCGDEAGDRVVCIRQKQVRRGEVEERLKAAGAAAVFFAAGAREAAPRITLGLGRMSYRVSAGVFFQANWGVNRNLVETVADLIARIGPSRVVDLFAGAGNFALAAAAWGARVMAVEENPLACRDARLNARRNGFRNITVMESPVSDFNLPAHADLLILDPPRPGLAEGVKKKILKAAPRHVLYVSCNPSTLARDLKRLGSAYELRSVRLVDMFPQTCHVEAAVLVALRS
jgi:23S rRNA (uracil1939-C5)-methyltransferase